MCPLPSHPNWVIMAAACRCQLMRQWLWGSLTWGRGSVAGQAVSLPLGTQKDIPEVQVAGAAATVTPVMARWLVIQLRASNVSAVYFILWWGRADVAGWGSIGKWPPQQCRDTHPALKIHCACTPSANPQCRKERRTLVGALSQECA